VAIPIGGKVLLDTNVFIDFLRAELHANWVFGGQGNLIRFTSGVVLMELNLGADTPARQRAVARIEDAFTGRIVAPSPAVFSRAGTLFRTLYGGMKGRSDRLAPMDDLLIALTARAIGATVITSNLAEFMRISHELPGLRVLAPAELG
jgi:predicted nucleic acid-binding protein